MAEKIYDNNYNSTELTKININVNEAFATKDDELHHIRLECHKFMYEQGYDRYISIKYTHKKTLNANTTNKIFISVMNEFNNKLISIVDIFSIISEYFEIDPVELYANLSQKIQNLLKMELVKTTRFTKNELFCQKTNDGKIMPSL